MACKHVVSDTRVAVDKREKPPRASIGIDPFGELFLFRPGRIINFFLPVREVLKAPDGVDGAEDDGEKNEGDLNDRFEPHGGAGL